MVNDSWLKSVCLYPFDFFFFFFSSFHYKILFYFKKMRKKTEKDDKSNPKQYRQLWIMQIFWYLFHSHLIISDILSGIIRWVDGTFWLFYPQKHRDWHCRTNESPFYPNRMEFWKLVFVDAKHNHIHDSPAPLGWTVLI